jgi:hypothetical protein
VRIRLHCEGIFSMGVWVRSPIRGRAAYINLEIEALHRRRAKCQAKPPELVGHERLDVEDSINLGRGHIGPAEAERRHALLAPGASSAVRW